MLGSICTLGTTICQTTVPTYLTSLLLGFVSTLLKLLEGTEGGRGSCMMAALLVTLKAAMNTGEVSL